MCKYHYVRKDGLENQVIKNLEKENNFVFRPAAENIKSSFECTSYEPIKIKITYRDEFDGRKNRVFKRTITIEELAPGLWQGTVMKKEAKTGDWFWNTKLFPQPLFVSGIIKMPNGARKRYAKNPINFAIRDAIESITATRKIEVA